MAHPDPTETVDGFTREQMRRHFLEEAGYAPERADVAVAVAFGDTPGDRIVVPEDAVAGEGALGDEESW